MNEYYVTFSVYSIVRGTENFAIHCETREQAVFVLKSVGYTRTGAAMQKDKPSENFKIMEYETFINL